MILLSLFDLNLEDESFFIISMLFIVVFLRIRDFFDYVLIILDEGR